MAAARKPDHLGDCDGVWPCSCITRVDGIEPTDEMLKEMEESRRPDTTRGRPTGGGGGAGRLKTSGGIETSDAVRWL